MPTTRSKKKVEKKPVAGKAAAKAAPKPAARAAAPARTVKAKAPAAKTAKTATAPKRTTAKPAAMKAAPAPKAKAAAPKAAANAKADIPMKAKAAAAPKAKAEAAPKAPVAKKAPAKAPAPKKPKVPAFAPRQVPIHELDGKAADPRLAAALAARERWHGRSGRPALKSATQAVAFVRERHLVHASVRSALPNLLDPVVGHTVSEEERSAGPIAQTLKAWRREIDAAPDLLEARLCFERPTLVGADLWPALVTVAAPREEAARRGGVLSVEAEEALDVLDRKGVVPADRLRQLVGLDAAAFASVHAELEARLLVVSRAGLDEDDNPITVVESLSRWAERNVQRKVELEIGRAWCFLFIAALRSAVVLWPEEIEALFPWSPEERNAAIAEAMTTGALITYTEGESTAWVASPVPR
ncbi:hypothetical protein [Vulgatibacter sp.]|uniref:hypothetical protein n=1 Tax=Vulgatibacter sp. TaxID=1971226 RepID=UPI00356AFF16